MLYTIWNDEWMSLLIIFDPGRLLCCERGIFGVHINLSIIAGPQARMGCFTAQAFAEREVVGFYYDRFVKQMIFYTLYARRAYRKVDIAATCEWLHTSAI